MKTDNAFQMVKDPKNKKVTIKRHLNGKLPLVWRAFTELELLEQWWAPKPWTTETKNFDFSEGGRWLYAMVGPEGEKQWGIMNYLKINPQKSYTANDFFTDEDGKKNEEFPTVHWETSFSENATGTEAQFVLTFASEKDLNALLEMGYEEGFTSTLAELDSIISSGKWS